jgi:hypothetical protein
MPQIIEYMNYSIFFSDAAEYAAAVGLTGGNIINISPRAAAAMFGIPYPYPAGDINTIPKGVAFYFPFNPGSEFQLSTNNHSSIFVDDSLDFQIVTQNAGNPASIWPAGPDIKFVWSCSIMRMGGAGVAANPSPNVFSQRRWAHGFEWQYFREGGFNPNSNNTCRDSSRTIEGKGFPIRGTSFGATYKSNIAEYRTVLLTDTSWERLYIRFRQLPATNPSGFIKFTGGPLAGDAGFGLVWNPDGTIEAFNRNIGAVLHSEGLLSLVPTLNIWYRFDFFVKFAAPGVDYGAIKIFVNGTEIFNFVDGIAHGLNATAYHEYSEVGLWGPGNDTDVEMDLDDWTNADLPANVSPVSLGWMNTDYPIDWLLGSHIKQHWNKNGSFVNWAPGNLGSLNYGEQGNSLAGSNTSTTSGATIAALTDALTQDIQDTLALVLGAVSATVGIATQCALNTDGELGYKLAGGAPVLATIDETAALKINSVMYLPSGAILPAEISPFSVVHTKSADANLNTVLGIEAAIEYLGVWGPEDDPMVDLGLSRLSNLHNCNYPNTPWGYFSSPSAAPVFIVAGTYVGNDVYNPIALPAPVHFLWIRNITAANQGQKWFAAGIGAHLGGDQTSGPNVRTWTELLDGSAWFSVSGNHANYNANGVTYQYIAFCDPGRRFNLCGAYAHGFNSASPTPNALIDPNFLPEAGFIGIQDIAATNAVAGIFYKGPGISANKGAKLGGGAIANSVMTFAQGILNTLSDVHSAYGSNHYSLWRTTESGCAGVMVQICNYTGDNQFARDIVLTPTSGRFPCFVMIVPDNGDPAIVRDPSHAGDNSSDAGNGNINHNGIVAIPAADTITVSITYNSLGVHYSVFAFPGDVAAMANGVYFNPICETPLGPYIIPAPLTGDIVVASEGGLDIGGSPLSPTDIMVVQDLSGIYTIVPGQTHDILQDRLPGQLTLNRKIPNPFFKTGYIGG